MNAELSRSIVLWCPDWPVRAAVLARPGTDPDGPVALLDRGLVFACSPVARRTGVRRGLRLREAQARCPSLVALPYDPGADARLFEPLLAAVEQRSPGVQPIRPGMLALRARGPARYFGGERQAAETLLAVLAETGAPGGRAGVADGPFAAEQAARRTGAETVRVVPPGGSPEFLAALPVTVADDAFAGLCRRLGLLTLGDLAALGEEELTLRFGETGARVHGLVTGCDAARVVPRTPQRVLQRSIAFDTGLDRVDQISFAVRQTADDVIAALASARLVCTAVTVTVETEREESERTWLHPRWFTAVDLVDRVRWQLQGVGPATGAPTSPVTRVTLTPESVDAAHHHEEGLWGDAPDERVHHALSRVQSMLGHDAVVTAAVGGGRMLLERQQLVPWGDRLPEGVVAAAAQPWPGSLPDPLPATVFREPPVVTLLSAAGTVVEVTGRGLLAAEPALFAPPGAPAGTVGPLTAWAGPWPIDERWWDAAAARRAHRLVVVGMDGLAWLLLGLGDGGWLAEGRYD